LGIDPNKPYTLFVGRITKQKGILHMIKAVRHMDRAFQVVIAARAPDTAELEAEVNALIAQVQRERPGVFWIRNLTDTPTKVALYSHAAVFCCPSIYEPFGIINLEAMACEVPVVASAVGGIKEVVVDGVTGLLVPVARQPVSPFEPIQPEQFEKDIAAKVNLLMRDKDLRTQMGKQGRRRVIEAFSWHSIAEKTYQLYRSYSHARK
jgi:glycosyltransferase involved in cell wall biosynthesis